MNKKTYVNNFSEWIKWVYILVLIMIISACAGFGYLAFCLHYIKGDSKLFFVYLSYGFAVIVSLYIFHLYKTFDERKKK